MEKEKVDQILKDWQTHIDNLPYKSTIPYPYCCICFERLTSDNVLVKYEKLINVCLECKDK